jgi:genome maintenance exonuclease 1
MKTATNTFKHTPIEASNIDLPVKEVDGQRYYKSPTGKFLPSVTTVTGWKKRQFFAEWRKKNAKESSRVLTRGNDFHELIERYLQNEDVSNVTLRNMMSQLLFEQIRSTLHNINNIHAQEMSLWGNIVPLAGRLDCLAEYNGKLSVIDVKASTKKKRKQDIHNYFLQATAYALLWQERTGLKIDNFAILISCESGEVQVFEGNPMEYTKDLFKCINDYYTEVTSNQSSI